MEDYSSIRAGIDSLVSEVLSLRRENTRLKNSLDRIKTKYESADGGGSSSGTSSLSKQGSSSKRSERRR
jgi:regulator of replication initiation timing